MSILKYIINLDAKSVASASNTVRTFTTSWRAFQALMRRDVVGALNAGSIAIKGLGAALKAVPIVGWVAIASAAVAGLFTMWERRANAALERTKALTKAYLKARRDAAELMNGSVPEQAKAMVESGNKAGLQERIDKAGKDYNSARAAVDAASWELTFASANNFSENNIAHFTERLKAATAQLEKTKEIYDTWNEAGKQLDEKNAEAKEKGAQYAELIEERRAERRGDVSLEALYRRRARQAREASVGITGDSPQDEAERLKLASEALDLEMKADALRKARGQRWQKEQASAQREQQAANEAEEDYRFNRLSDADKLSEVEKKMSALKQSGSDKDRAEFYNLAGQRDALKQSIADQERQRVDRAAADAQQRAERLAAARGALQDMRAPSVQAADISALFDRMYAGGTDAWNKQDQSLIDYAKRQVDYLKTIAENSQGVR